MSLEFEIRGRGRGEPWRVRPLNEKKVSSWLNSQGFTTGAGLPVTADFLRSRDDAEVEGTARNISHPSPLLDATMLAAEGRLRVVGIEVREEDARRRRELFDDLRVLARSIWGAKVVTWE